MAYHIFVLAFFGWEFEPEHIRYNFAMNCQSEFHKQDYKHYPRLR